MEKLFIYGGIFVFGSLGAYLPVVIFGANPFGFASIAFGFFGSLLGLWIGYKANQNF